MEKIEVEESFMTPAQEYENMLLQDRENITMEELLHPPYQTEAEYIDIVRVWEARRHWWQQTHKEVLKQPKRNRTGRPSTGGAPKSGSRSAMARSSGEGYDIVLRIGLPENIMTGLLAIKGPLTLAETIRQILSHHLGPLADPQNNK